MSLRRGVGRLLLAAVAALLAYAAFTAGQVWWASRTEAAASADAIVVLGAAQWDGRPSPVLQARLDHAADLYRRGIAPIIVVTGGKQGGDRVTQGFAAYRYLREEGIPEEALRVEVDGTNTYEELSASANILRAEDLGSRVVVVSDPYHVFRGTQVAAEVGLDPLGSPADTGTSVSSLARETAAVAVGRIVSYRRLANWIT